MFLIMDIDGSLSLKADLVGTPPLWVNLDPYSYLGDGVELHVNFKQTDQVVNADTVKLDISFIDQATNDVIYKFVGSLSDDINQTNSLMSIVDATEEFKDFEVKVGAGFSQAIVLSSAYNNLDSLGRSKKVLTWQSNTPPSNIDSLAKTLTRGKNKPTRLYMFFDNNVTVFTQLMRVMDKLNIRLFVELDPMLTVDQAIQTANDLAADDDRVSFIWSPNVARPINAQSLKGRKVARLIGGTLMAWHTLRDANMDAQGIPAYHNPVAGYDYPFSYRGLDQRPDIDLDDTTRKRLANARINVMQVIDFRAGSRFILGDVLTANNNNTSLLKLINASDISMFIANTINAITMRHLLKGMTTYIEDATKECVKFLDSCCTKNRPLLVHSETLNGFYKFTITPRQDRPFDAVDVKLGCRPQGATRAAYNDFAVEK
ncbi:hypothetical protein DJ533_00210 (plasmid) [Acinetobacter defluvii]|uniref:Uncharacterized protein n=1 Tax=Acinetobacter defluvii TaxID=1871111 RepID=A0A2S2F9Y5_9GAMM|nr:hypothetical protein [Acinetobacter defluvii]AWL27142.1 hypothetical protein DJ533_00210 [Acinetobacter defluvii]